MNRESLWFGAEVAVALEFVGARGCDAVSRGCDAVSQAVILSGTTCCDVVVPCGDVECPVAR